MPVLSREQLMLRWTSAGDAVATRITVTCATRRLAASLNETYAHQRMADGLLAWPAPHCLPWNAWLRELHDCLATRRASRGEAAPILLSEAESLAIWLQIVERARRDQPLLQPALAARLAREAWQMAHEGGIDLPLRDAADPDTRAFNHWSGQYAKRLEALGAWDTAQLPGRLTAAIARGELPAPPTLVLAGFDDLPQARQALITAAQTAGSEVLELEALKLGQRISVRVATDPAQELQQAARQVREWALAEPDARIAVVLPDLASRRDMLLRCFDDALRGQGEDCPRPYNISLGTPLAAQPLIADALAWLDWACASAPMPISRVSERLHSGYWAGRPHLDALSDLDWRWRNDRRERLSLPVATALARPREGASEGRQRLAAALAGLRLPAGAHQPSDWAQAFADALAALGWPDSGSLGSEEYQALQDWQQQLMLLGALDSILGPLPAREALRILREQLTGVVFQPETPDTAVQVLGALEAAGLGFDHLLVLGLDDDTWPPPPSPNPFLPLQVQRAAGLPNADARIQLRYAQRTMTRLLASAPDIVLSHAARVDDRELMPSPLIPADAVRAEPMHGVDGPESWQRLHAARAVQSIDDARGDTLPENALVSGGTQRLADQAACPFRSYARHELGARAPEEPTAPLDHRERGLLAHEALARLWRLWRDQATMLAQSPEARDEALRTQIGLTLDRFGGQFPHRLSVAARQIEAMRLQRLIGQLLALDAERLPFRVGLIEGTAPDQAEDRGRQAHFGELSWTVRPDRVDIVEDHGAVLIDYKTGQPSGFADARLLAPQLPFYALQLDNCIAVSYALLRPGEVRYAGLSADESTEALPSVTALSKAKLDSELRAGGWPALLSHWETQLGVLAQEIRDGHASVTPWNRGSCQNCDLHALCRVRETVNALIDSDAEVDA
jgi:ATP-dependent helicase/nuclease subunit B